MAEHQNFDTYAVSSGTTGVTGDISVGNTLNHTIQMKVTSYAADIVVATEGSVDGVDFFTLTPENTATANFSISNGQATLGANGTYYLNYKNTPLSSLRLNFSSGTGTIASKYMGYR